MIDTFEYILNKYKIEIGSKSHIVEIPNMGRVQLAELFAELKFKRGAEIGVEKGVYSAALLKTNLKLKLFSIDPWKASSYEPGIEGVRYNQSHYERCYKMAKGKLRNLNCKIIRKTSMKAVKDFKDKSLDFVYIDGNHNFPNVINDIHEWRKKVKTGGIVSGHDYMYFSSQYHNHVKHALLAYTKAYGIKPLFIVGTETYDKGVIRDRIRSWFWVKFA